MGFSNILEYIIQSLRTSSFKRNVFCFFLLKHLRNNTFFYMNIAYSSQFIYSSLNADCIISHWLKITRVLFWKCDTWIEICCQTSLVNVSVKIKIFVNKLIYFLLREFCFQIVSVCYSYCQRKQFHTNPQIVNRKCIEIDTQYLVQYGNFGLQRHLPKMLVKQAVRFRDWFV